MKDKNDSPIYVVGRQHSGNTMLVTMLDRHPDIHGFKGEGNFFEQLPSLSTLDEFQKKVEAVVAEIARAADPPLDECHQDEIRAHLRSSVRDSDSIVVDYLAGKAYLADREGANRWAQKATSYIFHIRTIVRHLPSAQFLFVLRNPLDIAASLKRRGSKEEWARMAFGWVRGVKRARTLESDMPARFHIVKYEDLVMDPASSLQEMCSFCGLEYKENMLNVPHVNRSETPYNQDSEEAGISNDRVLYFTDHLTSSEIGGLERTVGKDILRTLYPSVVSATKEKGGGLLEQVRILGRGGVHLLTEQAGLLSEDPRRAINRWWRRIF